MKFFLDIDGVMVHAIPYRKVELADDGFYEFNSVAVEILKSVISITKDELILSTSHRFKYSIPEWHQIFNTSLTKEHNQTATEKLSVVLPSIPHLSPR